MPTAPAAAATRAGLGAEGAALSVEEAVAYVSRARGERKRPSSGWASLTPAELDVARLAAEGVSNAQIARQLFIAVGTTKTPPLPQPRRTRHRRPRPADGRGDPLRGGDRGPTDRA